MVDTAVRESRDRVISAICLSGFGLPNNILVNLAPAEVKKEGAAFDLAIALGILMASGQVRSETPAQRMVHGELSLDGAIKPVRGVVALAVDALQQGVQEFIVPWLNYAEATLVTGLRVTAVRSLAELAAYLNGRALTEQPKEFPPSLGSGRCGNLNEVVGQQSAKRALLIAAAGGHNALMIGPPGCGKSMLAQRFPALLPLLSPEEKLEAVKIHSIAGLPVQGLLEGMPPYRSPHYGISDAGLIGGGMLPRPGEISLAHRGVLFLDEFPEYRRAALEALRGPIEDGWVTVTRARGSCRFPAQFQLLAAMNPCPCGRLGIPGVSCVCPAGAIQAYLRKLSEPILDRIDLHVALEAVPLHLLSNQLNAEASHSEAELSQEQVSLARARAKARSGCLNAQLSQKAVVDCVKLTAGAESLLKDVARKGRLSARGFIRTLKVARTVADLQSAEQIGETHLAEALTFKGLESLQRYCLNSTASTKHL